MSLYKKLGLAGVIGFLAAGPSLAQGLGVGATVGLVNDIGGQFHVDEFDHTDVNLFVDYEAQEKVMVRMTFGTLKVKGSNAGQQVTLPDGASVILPDLTNQIDYGTIGVSYLFTETGYTSGIFAGIGGYKVRPEPVDEAIANYRDQRETVFGWHFGVEGGVQMIPRISLQVRLTYHHLYTEPRPQAESRSILTANAGVVYRF